MPFAGFICHISGEPVSPEDCLACARKGGGRTGDELCPFTPPIVSGLIEANQPRELMGYSATELFGCPRSTVLKEHVDYWVEPAKAYWAFRGQLAHSIVEAAAAGEPDVLAEVRFHAQCDGMLVSGKPDIVHVRRKLVVDYKTTKRVPGTRYRYTCPECDHVLRCNQWRARRGSTLTCSACGAEHPANDVAPEELPPTAYDNHVRQLNIYRWLLAKNDVAIEQAEVLYMDMSAVLRVPVELWALEHTEVLVQAGLACLLETGEDGFPQGVQNDEDANWECRYCPVAGQCERIAEEAADQPTGVTPAETAAILYPG